jgi:hypothetical protein
MRISTDYVILFNFIFISYIRLLLSVLLIITIITTDFQVIVLIATNYQCC